MASRLFPKTKARGKTNEYGGSAGSSSSANKPGAGTGDYQRGFTGSKWSRQGGGQSLLQGRVDRPQYNEKSGPGDGGCAWDSSMSQYLKAPNRGPGKY